MKLALVVIGLLLAVPARAQSPLDTGPRDALAWPAADRHIADTLSTVAVGAAIATPCLLERTRTCVTHEAVRVGAALALSLLAKRAVHRVRPDGSDDRSWFSMHTALACASTLGTKVWEFCPAVAYSRIAADKHWLTDVGTGATIGAVLTVVW